VELERKSKEIKDGTAEVLHESLRLLKQLAFVLEWEDEKQYKEYMYMIATLGLVITKEEYKDTLLYYCKEINKDIDEDDDTIDNALYYINDA
tara:strand:+ start:1199 stop:1474 length:276 start_codon:yes stop_codon:yes gene_type:complete